MGKKVAFPHFGHIHFGFMPVLSISTSDFFHCRWQWLHFNFHDGKKVASAIARPVSATISQEFHGDGTSAIIEQSIVSTTIGRTTQSLIAVLMFTPLGFEL
jgi:hypothetical protein